MTVDRAETLESEVRAKFGWQARVWVNRYRKGWRARVGMWGSLVAAQNGRTEASARRRLLAQVRAMEVETCYV